MSPYVTTWLIQGAALLAVLASFFARTPWMFLVAVALIILAMVWPRCGKCGLPTFWQKAPSAPDHFVYYLGKRLNPLPPQTCSRCGEDLTI